MLKFLFKTFIFWRSNHALSILFKASVFAVFALLVVSPFLDLQKTLVVGGIVAAIFVIKYYLQYRREQVLMLNFVNGDLDKLKALKQKVKAGKMGGALFMELLRAEVDDVAEEEPELTDEQRSQNRSASQANLDRILALVEDHPSVEINDKAVRVAECVEDFSNGEYICEPNSFLEHLFPERYLSICYEDYCNEDDHAQLLRYVAEQTQSDWNPTECSSGYDEEMDKWTIQFDDSGKEVKWRFNQSNDWINDNFLSKLLSYAEEKSGMRILPLNTEDWFEAVVFPPEFCEQLAGDELARAA